MALSGNKKADAVRILPYIQKDGKTYVVSSCSQAGGVSYNFILNEVKERDMPDFFNEPVGTLFWDKHLITKQFLIDNGKLNEAK